MGIIRSYHASNQVPGGYAGRVSTDGFPEPIIHVDMDAFFVEAERLRDPGLRGVPVVVGGAGDRGVVASASYEARVEGVRSAMPMVTARRLCPSLVILPGDHAHYRRVSEMVFAIFREITPRVEGLSIDEAFLDVGGLRRHHPSALAVAQHVRQRIRRELGLPSSAGVAAVKFIAKMASAAAKPDGVLLVTVEDQVHFLHARPVRDLWGVGEATFAKLERFGVETIGDVAALPEGTLVRALGPSLGRQLHRLAWARDERAVEPEGEAKSVSVEETFPHDIRGSEVLSTELLRLCDTLGYRLHRAGLAGRTIALKVRFSDFTTISRTHSLNHHTALTREIHHHARRLLARAVGPGQAVRLLGVGISSLANVDERQLSIEDQAERDALQEAVHLLRDRFGESAVGPARLAPGAASTESGDEAPITDDHRWL